MPDKPQSEVEAAIVVRMTRNGGCPHCTPASFGEPYVDVVPLSSEEIENPIEITTLKQHKDGLRAAGKISYTYCPKCGMAIREINRRIPIELQDLLCQCGGNQFRFSISSIKPNRTQRATAWRFELDVTCKACSRVNFVKRIASLFKLKRIKVGPGGVDIVMH
jgi:hypothetical protein